MGKSSRHLIDEIKNVNPTQSENTTIALLEAEHAHRKEEEHNGETHGMGAGGYWHKFKFEEKMDFDIYDCGSCYDSCWQEEEDDDGVRLPPRKALDKAIQLAYLAEEHLMRREE